MRKPVVLCGALLCLTGAVSANEVTDQLLSMPERERHAELTRRLKTTGNACDLVTRSMHMNNNSNGTSAWSVECRDKNSYAVVLGPAASHMVVAWKCADLIRMMPGLECFKK